MSLDSASLRSLVGSKLVSDLDMAYRSFDMPIKRYLGFVVFPSIAIFIGSIAAVLLLPYPIMVRGPIPILGVLVLFAAIMYPKLQFDSRRRKIQNSFHLLMTHLTVLSTTNIDRMEVFRELAAEREYGAGAEELGYLVQLVDKWNQSLDDACRRRARVVPSDVLADFYERLGYTLSAGQALDDFMINEQQFIIDKYETIYESELANVEVMKDLYLSLILSMTFALVFAIILPILIGSDPTLLVAAVMVLFIFIQTGFYVAIRNMSPADPVWYFPEERPRTDTMLLIGSGIAWILVISFAILAIAGEFEIGPGIDGVLFFMDDPPAPLALAIGVSPLLPLGILSRRWEGQIVQRNQEFPSFIRALGSSESAKQSPTSDVLKTLREKNFGALSPPIERLYRRLNARLDTRAAWEAFALDTRSSLAQKFSEMYVTGRQMGGEPKQLGELISKNMNTVNQLREQRRQSAITLIGVLYGISAAATFAFFVGLEVVVLLTDISTEMGLSDLEVGSLIHPEHYNLPLLEWLLLGVIFMNAVLSSMMIRTVDGGRLMSGYVHIVGLVWVSCIVALITGMVVSGVLT